MEATNYILETDCGVAYCFRFHPGILGTLIVGFIEVDGEIVEDYEFQIYPRTRTHYESN